MDLSTLLNLSKEEYEDNTHGIRQEKNSQLIRQELDILDTYLASKEARNLTTQEKIMAAASHVPFLHHRFTDLYIRAIREELNRGIMDRLLLVLGDIEDGRLDQNEGSIKVGEILKELYLDSMVTRGRHLDEAAAAASAAADTTNPTLAPQPIKIGVTWKSFKHQASSSSSSSSH